MVKSDYGRTFGFFVPTKFEERKVFIGTDKQLAFYWINDDKLITAVKSSDPLFYSNDEGLVVLFGMYIPNDRN